MGDLNSFSGVEVLPKRIVVAFALLSWLQLLLSVVDFISNLVAAGDCYTEACDRVWCFAGGVLRWIGASHWEEIGGDCLPLY